MTLNWIGLVAALATFCGVWIGHVSVRKIEAQATSLWPPMLAAIALGLTLELVALLTPDLAISGACGILGITALWDALEFRRQEHRIARGHAPANPHNPRHARLLAQANSRATTLDLLARAPVGRPVAAAEAVQLARQAHAPAARTQEASQ